MEFTISKIQKTILFISIAFIIFKDLYNLYIIKIINNTFINYTMDLLVNISGIFICVFFIFWFKHIQQRYLMGLAYIALVSNLITIIMEYLYKLNLIEIDLDFLSILYSSIADNVFYIIWFILILLIPKSENKALKYLNYMALINVISALIPFVMFFNVALLWKRIESVEYMAYLFLITKYVTYLFFILCVKEIKTQPIINLD